MNTEVFKDICLYLALDIFKKLFAQGNVTRGCSLSDWELPPDSEESPANTPVIFVRNSPNADIVS